MFMRMLVIRLYTWAWTISHKRGYTCNLITCTLLTSSCHRPDVTDGEFLEKHDLSAGKAAPMRPCCAVAVLFSSVACQVSACVHDDPTTAQIQQSRSCKSISFGTAQWRWFNGAKQTACQNARAQMSSVPEFIQC